MSVMRDLTIAVLMRLSLDIREMDGPVQVNDVVMAAVKLEVRQLLWKL